MKPPKWPRAPPPPSLTGGNAPATRPFWSTTNATPDSSSSTSKPFGANKPHTDYSHLRHRRAPSPRREWPLLKRRSDTQYTAQKGAPSANPRHRNRTRPHGPSRGDTRQSFPQDDAEFERYLSRVASTKAEFDASHIPAGSEYAPGTEIDWSKLEAAAPTAGQPGVVWWDGLSEKERKLQTMVSTSAKKNMLFIRGVSTSLLASDFHRIAGRSLTDWSSGIKRVEQQRDPQTLKPLGCYQVSFSNAIAAQSYADNLTRLQRLAQHRMAPSSGLWESTVPPHLLRSGNETREDIARDLKNLTIASPSQASLYVKRARTKIRYPWVGELKSLARGCGFGEKPPVAVLSISHGRISKEDLAELIKKDGQERDLAWKASEPVPLNMTAKPAHLSLKQHKIVQESQQGDSSELEARFVLAFESEWEARSFHRCWHQREVQTYTAFSDTHQETSMASVEIIEW